MTAALLGGRSSGRVPTPYELLAARADRGRPFMTAYDGPDSCIELSGTTTMNAVAKAAGLLRDELGLTPGDRLSVDLPVHWQLPVWTLAGLSAGLVCGRFVADPVEVRIVGPTGLSELAAGADPRADEVLGCSCDAFGMPVRGGVPAGVTDVGIAVRAHPDVYQVSPEAGGRAGLLVPADPADVGDHGLVLVAWAQIVAAGSAEAGGARTWVTSEDLVAAGLPPAALLRTAAVDPLLRGGSVVLARDVSAEDAQRLRAEQGAAPGRSGASTPAVPGSTPDRSA